MIGMRPTTKLLTIAAALALSLACTNSGLQDTLTTGTAAGTPGTGPGGGPGGTGTGTGNGGGSCDWTGTWAVSTADCGAFVIDTDWFAVYTETTMVISDSGAGDGSCTVDFSWSGEGCAEEETWEITQSSDTSWSVRFGGIDTCAPDACTFFGNDDTCLVGDRVLATPLTFDVTQLSPTEIEIIGLFGDEELWVESGYPQCTLDLKTTWTKQ